MESTPSPHITLTADSEGSPEAEAYRFEALQPGREKKKHGVFYTPVALADEILSEVFAGRIAESSPETILRWRILDPACGSGLFLIRALRLLVAELKSLGIPKETAAERLLTNCLYGVDCDPKAVDRTKALLSRAAAEYGCTISPERIDTIRCGNSLLATDVLDAPGLPAGLAPFSWLAEFPHLKQEDGFDFVIGNPPYGLSRDEQISSLENKALQDLYEPFRTGKINKYLAFIALGYRLLKRGGSLSYVVPNSWLGIRSGSALRTLLLSEYAIERLTIFEYPLFSDPSVECVTFIARKAQKHTSFELIRKRDKSSSPTISAVPHDAFLKERDCRISTLWSAEDSEVIARMREQSIPLASAETPFLPLIALQAYATGKGTPAQTLEQVKGQVFHCDTREDESCHPYLEGADIGRFSVLWSGRFLRHGKWLAEPQTITRFSGPRVVLREILNPLPHVLSAAYLDATFLYNKSVLHIIAKNSTSPEIMQALCALLNSRLVSYYLKLCGCKSQRKLFPKIVNDDLRELPLPKAFADAAGELARICSKKSTGDVASALDDELEAVAATLYGLSSTQRARVQEFIHTR